MTPRFGTRWAITYDRDLDLNDGWLIASLKASHHVDALGVAIGRATVEKCRMTPLRGSPNQRESEKKRWQNEYAQAVIIPSFQQATTESTRSTTRRPLVIWCKWFACLGHQHRTQWGSATLRQR